MTGYAEVIGDPIAQSKSPAIHNFWLDKVGIEAEYRATRVTADDLTDYLESRQNDPDWRGCNVTMPLKQTITSRLFHVEPIAKTLGATNTVYRNADGALVGTNTDAAGFLEPLQSILGRTHLFRMARVIGTGGAARAIVAMLAKHGFTIVLAGRNPEKARAMLDELASGGEHHAISIDHFAAPTDFAFDDRAGCCDLIVNASPLGMTDQPPLAFDIDHAPPGSIFYDIVTSPHNSQFLKNARAHGFETIDGLSMLIGQADRAFELFFGTKPPREHDAELRAMLTA